MINQKMAYGMTGNLKRVLLKASWRSQKVRQTLFLFLLILTSLISWKMMPVVCSFSLNPCITGSSSVRRFSCAKHTPEVFLRSPFSQFHLSLFSDLPGLAHWVTQDSRAWSEKARWLRWHLMRLEWCWLAGGKHPEDTFGVIFSSAFCWWILVPEGTVPQLWQCQQEVWGPALSAGCAQGGSTPPQAYLVCA